MLGEQFMVGDEICGAVISVRYQVTFINVQFTTCLTALDNWNSAWLQWKFSRNISNVMSQPQYTQANRFNGHRDVIIRCPFACLSLND